MPKRSSPNLSGCNHCSFLLGRVLALKCELVSFHAYVVRTPDRESCAVAVCPHRRKVSTISDECADALHVEILCPLVSQSFQLTAVFLQQLAPAHSSCRAEQLTAVFSSSSPQLTRAVGSSSSSKHFVKYDSLRWSHRLNAPSIFVNIIFTYMCVAPPCGCHERSPLLLLLLLLILVLLLLLPLPVAATYA